jgi:Zn-dependent protease with chaperone function
VSPSVLVPIFASAVVVAVVMSPVVPRLAESLLERRSQAPSVFWAGAVLAPAAIAGLIATAFLFPAPFGACHCAAHGPHHPHLCMAHPELARSLLLPAALLILGWAVPAGRQLFRAAAEASRTSRWIRQLAGRSVRVDGIPVLLADFGEPLAVTAGAFNPRIVCDSELWAALSPEQRRIIVHHEHAHVLRGDALTLLALRVAAALCLVPFAARYIAHWRAAAEFDCDLHASAVVGDPLAVASALLAVERRCGPATAASGHEVLAARPGALLERRVRALLDPAARRSVSLANDVLLVGCAVVSFALLVLVWPDDGVHHAFEMLLGWAFH